MLIEEGLALESKWRGRKWLGTKRSPKQVSWLVCQDGELFYSTCWCACDSCNFGRRPQCIETSPFSGINTVCCDSCNISPGKCCIPCLCAKLFRFSAMFLLFVSSLFVAPETSWALLKVPFCTASQSLLPDQSSHFLVVNCLSDPFIPLAFLSSVALAPGVAARLQCSVGVCQEGWNKMQLCNSYSQPSWFNASCRCTAGITSLPLGEWFWREKGMWTSCMCVCETMCYSQPWVSHTYACLYIYVCAHRHLLSVPPVLWSLKGMQTEGQFTACMSRHCFAWLRCSTYLLLQAGREMRYSAVSLGRWLVPSSAGAGLVIPSAFLSWP